MVAIASLRVMKIQVDSCLRDKLRSRYGNCSVVCWLWLSSVSFSSRFVSLILQRMIRYRTCMRTWRTSGFSTEYLFIPRKFQIHAIIANYVPTLPVYLTNRFHVAVRVFKNRSQKTSKCGKNIVTHSAFALHCEPLFCSYHILTSSVIYYWTDARQHGIYFLNRLEDWECN